STSTDRGASRAARIVAAGVRLREAQDPRRRRREFRRLTELASALEILFAVLVVQDVEVPARCAGIVSGTVNARLRRTFLPANGRDAGCRWVRCSAAALAQPSPGCQEHQPDHPGGPKPPKVVPRGCGTGPG